MRSIDTVWERLKAAEGGTFWSRRGKPFSYRVEDDLRIVLEPPLRGRVARSQFQRVLPFLPVDGPKSLSQASGVDVWGPTYIWGILHDKRIRGNDW